MSYHCNFRQARVLDKGSEMDALSASPPLALVAFDGLCNIPE
jgi:hypothetical protein